MAEAPPEEHRVDRAMLGLRRALSQLAEAAPSTPMKAAAGKDSKSLGRLRDAELGLDSAMRHLTQLLAAAAAEAGPPRRPPPPSTPPRAAPPEGGGTEPRQPVRALASVETPPRRAQAPSPLSAQKGARQRLAAPGAAPPGPAPWKPPWAPPGPSTPEATTPRRRRSVPPRPRPTPATSVTPVPRPWAETWSSPLSSIAPTPPPGPALSWTPPGSAAEAAAPPEATPSPPPATARPAPRDLASGLSAFPPPAPDAAQLAAAAAAEAGADLRALIAAAGRAALLCPRAAPLAEALADVATRELAELRRAHAFARGAGAAEEFEGRAVALRASSAEGLRMLEAAMAGGEPPEERQLATPPQQPLRVQVRLQELPQHVGAAADAHEERLDRRDAGLQEAAAPRPASPAPALREVMRGLASDMRSAIDGIRAARRCTAPPPAPPAPRQSRIEELSARLRALQGRLA